MCGHRLWILGVSHQPYSLFVFTFVWKDGRTVVGRAGRLVRTTYRQTDSAHSPVCTNNYLQYVVVHKANKTRAKPKRPTKKEPEATGATSTQAYGRTTTPKSRACSVKNKCSRFRLSPTLRKCNILENWRGAWKWILSMPSTTPKGKSKTNFNLNGSIDIGAS